MGAEYTFTPNYRVEQWAILHFHIYLQSKIIERHFFPSPKYSRLSSIFLRASLKPLMFPSLSGMSLTSFLLFVPWFCQWEWINPMVTPINLIKFNVLSMIWGFTWQSVYMTLWKSICRAGMESNSKERWRETKGSVWMGSKCISGQFSRDCSHSVTVTASPADLPLEGESREERLDYEDCPQGEACSPGDIQPLDI